MKKLLFLLLVGVGLAISASSCDTDPEIEQARLKCEEAHGVFTESEADDGSNVYSCVV